MSLNFLKKLERSKALSKGSFDRFKILSLFFLLLFCSIAGIAQVKKQISGTITNDKGTPLQGITVSVKNSNQTTISTANGTYSMEVAEGSVLIFSSVGFETYEMKVGKNTAYQISLRSSTQGLDEVVVIGYGTQKRTTLTGAIATVSSKTLNELPVAGIDQALQGRVAGLQVTNNGAPGEPAIIAIRGISSINGNASPLYVIDGIPSTSGLPNNFDSRDIESLEVLKDASAAAIYGSRATNGVILVSTKKGKRNGKLQVNLDSYIGIQNINNKLDLLNTTQYVQYATALLGAANLPPRLQDANFNQPLYAGTTQTFAQTNTDWQDEYFVKNALNTQHSLSVSGGNEVSRFYAAGGYLKQEAITPGFGFERGNFRINSEHLVSKAVTFGQTLYLSVSNQQTTPTSFNRTALSDVIKIQPYLPVRNPNSLGGFFGPDNSFDGSDPVNPVEPALLEDHRNKSLKLLASAYVDINLTSYLKFRSTFGIDYTRVNSSDYSPIADDGGTYVSPTAFIGFSTNNNTSLLYTQQLGFNKSFGNHNVNAVAVFETQGVKANIGFQAGTQATNDVRTLKGASNISAGYENYESFIASYVGRLTYDFANKYLLSATFRRDGLSVWAPGNKYGNFPSVSAGWRIDKENFMLNAKAISELKIRGGYGITGLNPTSLGYYPWQSIVQSNGAVYPFGGSLENGASSFYNELGNDALRWETTKQLNIGADIGFLNNKFTLTAEYFKRKTDNLILNVPTPASIGFGGTGVDANVAAMENSGFEFQGGYHKTAGLFKWDVVGLISFINNKVLSLNTPNAAIGAGGDGDFGGGADVTRTVAGRPVQSFYGWVTDGLFQSDAQVAASATQFPDTKAGDIKFKDLNGDGAITDADRTFLGSYLPKFTYSLNTSIAYKSFDASIFFQGIQGNKVFNGQRIVLEGMRRLFNAGTNVLNAWTPTNTNTDIPRAVNGDPNQNIRPSNRWIEDGSYLRLKNIIIGYTIPESFLKSFAKKSITRFRVYVASQNLLTFTNYKGWDPEIGTLRSTLTNGMDYGQYPSARSFQFGLQVGF